MYPLTEEYILFLAVPRVAQWAPMVPYEEIKYLHMYFLKMHVWI